jgi:hypothetical protein
MKTKTVILLSLLSLALAGCVTPEATKPAAPGMDLRQFRKVKLVVTNFVQSVYAIKAMPEFEGLLKGRLQSCGYTLVDADPELVVEVMVKQFDPGSRSTRLWVGFGAGRSVLKFTAQFSDPTGKLLAELQGGKSYSGMEFNDNATWKSDEGIRMGMISYSVSQIGEFIEHNGQVK